jgi:flavin reductase (DIM6/NTAB) family NADH-FMN oxidoreductase RutF
MDYTPELGHGLPHDPFKSLTVPRPIGWLSTISPEGVVNLAPYSQWQNLTWDPPMVMLAANQSVHGGRKDTVRNAEETGWFVLEHGDLGSPGGRRNLRSRKRGIDDHLREPGRSGRRLAVN